MRAWTAATPRPADAPAVWCVDLALDETQRSACRRVLCEAERARADRFLRQEDRDRFIASHAALRAILAGTLGVPPRALAFATDEAGKPMLAAPCRGRLSFNLSHSGGWALVGLSPKVPIGIDIEQVRPLPDMLGIARGYFSARETAVLERIPARERIAAFYACWTRKEAFVKAVGLGLSMELARFTVSIPPEPAALLDIDGDAAPARGWSLIHLDPAPGHVGAVAIEAAEAGCSLLSLRPDWPDCLT